MRRITVKDLKKAIRGLPDDALVCMYSDSEGNNQSTALDYYYDVVGKVHVVKDNLDKELKFIGAEEIFGVDQEKDKGKAVLILVPSL